MTKHIIDKAGRNRPESRVMRYETTARRLSDETEDRRILGLRRRAKGPFDPAARMRAFLRIERGYSV